MYRVGGKGARLRRTAAADQGVSEFRHEENAAVTRNAAGARPGFQMRSNSERLREQAAGLSNAEWDLLGKVTRLRQGYGVASE